MISALKRRRRRRRAAMARRACAGRAVALSRGRGVRCAAAPARRRNHPREALPQAAPGTAVPVDGRDRELDGAQGRLGADRADDLCRAREPAQDRARQGRAVDQGDRRGGAPRACRDHREAGASVSVREGARGLGRRPGALPADGPGVSRRNDDARIGIVALALLAAGIAAGAQAQDAHAALAHQRGRDRRGGAGRRARDRRSARGVRLCAGQPAGARAGLSDRELFLFPLHS